MFVSLRTRLTVLYAGLFCLALLVVCAAAYGLTAAVAQKQVRGELVAGGAVFDRIWNLRERQLADGAGVLSRDFGFRAAVATQDGPTVESALSNLRQRLGLDHAFLVGMDGEVRGMAVDEATALDLWTALDSGATSGVLRLGDGSYQAIASPVMAPDLQGWLVFGLRLDRRELQSLEALSPIPLTAAVLSQVDGAWVVDDLSGSDAGRLAAFAAQAIKGGEAAPQKLTTDAGATIALAKPLKSFDGQAATMLVLRYPLAAALAPYRALLLVLIGLAVASLIALVGGSWLLARSITRPVSVLDDAAHRLERGEDVEVNIAGRDEISRLAVSFNAMAAGIREREGRILHLAQTDMESGLKTRQALSETMAGQVSGIVAVIGIERLAKVRGAIGYHATGELIAQIGARLSALSNHAPVGRLSSERLGLLLTARSVDGAWHEAATILEHLEEPFHVGGEDVDVTFTAGLAPIEPDAEIPALERASIALDQARQSGVKIGEFDAKAYGDPASNLSLMSQMLTALNDGSISLHYQPKYDLRAGVIHGAEALVRWRHPERGMIAPDAFVTLAEETGHIRDLTYWTLERLIADHAELSAAGHQVLLSLNLSGRMLGDEAFAERAISRMIESGVRICFEITETAMIGNPRQALAMLDRLRAAGATISLDDYGSGLSSLTYLKQIPADELKIDKSFIQNLSESARDALMVKSTIDLAHSLGMKLVAEGIETAEIMAALTAMGCDLVQGYYIARPMALAQLIEFLPYSSEQPRASSAVA